jgi:hypothetical protein
MWTRNLVKGAAVCAATAWLAAGMSAQGPNPRYGKWKLKSDAPAPTSNLMTYEPLNGGKGMKITIDAVNKDGVASKWGYNTMFDGKDEPLYGNPGTDTGAVKVVTDRINEIVYKKNGKVTQVLTNVLAPDNKTIGVMYIRMTAEGAVSGITVATYEKIQ